MHQIEIYELCVIVMPLSQSITLDVLYHRKEKNAIFSHSSTGKIGKWSGSLTEDLMLLLHIDNITAFDILVMAAAKTSAVIIVS